MNALIEALANDVRACDTYLSGAADSPTVHYALLRMRYAFQCALGRALLAEAGYPCDDVDAAVSTAAKFLGD